MTTWGYILDMPGRPSVADQKRGLSALGVDVGKTGTCWTDRIAAAKRHRSAGQSQLDERNALLAAVMTGDVVVACDPRCLGFSGQDVAWFIQQLSDRGVTLTVNGDLRHIKPGDDAAALASDAHRLIRNANVARSRGRSE